MKALRDPQGPNANNNNNNNITNNIYIVYATTKECSV